MAGGQPPVEPILVPPLGIVTRRSTDVLAKNDAQLVAGMRFMRQHLFDELRVNDPARAAGLSRRVFERRFAAQVGLPLKAEVLRLRLERVKAADTDWPLAQIAERTGFKHGECLHTVFIQKVGSTPGQAGIAGTCTFPLQESNTEMGFASNRFVVAPTCFLEATIKQPSIGLPFVSFREKSDTMLFSRGGLACLLTTNV
jgi:AraC-like DNA-binding protein